MTGPGSPETGTRPSPRATTENVTRAAPRRPRTGGLGEWLTASLVIAAGKVAVRLPDGLVWAMGNVVGEIAYRVSRPRRERARRNLRRIVGWMAETGTGAERDRAAATDPNALEGLVRSAFRQHAHYSFELVRAPRFTARYITERMLIDTPEVVEEGLSVRRAVIVLGMHLGAIEMPGIYCVSRLGSIVAPMESVRNPRIQRYLYSTRATIGVRIVGLDEGRELVAALRRNEPVGIVGDRAITGAGIETSLFGYPAKIPAGPAFMAVESGAPIYAGAARRTGPGRYLGSLRPVPIPDSGSRKERIRAIVDAEARVFEQLIALAPDQWLAVFHQVWPDLDGAPRGSSGETE
jgi:phosphatidylinositol dimannoside acyltransferase